MKVVSIIFWLLIFVVVGFILVKFIYKNIKQIVLTIKEKRKGDNKDE